MDYYGVSQGHRISCSRLQACSCRRRLLLKNSEHMASINLRPFDGVWSTRGSGANPGRAKHRGPEVGGSAGTGSKGS